MSAVRVLFKRTRCITSTLTSTTTPTLCSSMDNSSTPGRTAEPSPAVSILLRERREGPAGLGARLAQY